MKLVQLLLMATLIILTGTAFAQKRGNTDTLSHATIYTCPMHDSIASKMPGNCPVCGMKLTASKKEEMKMQQTKRYTCPVHTEVTSNHPGKCPKCGKALTGSPKEQMKAKVVKLYTCPMHPEVALEHDGTCPKCGSQLVEKKN